MSPGKPLETKKEGAGEAPVEALPPLQINIEDPALRKRLENYKRQRMRGSLNNAAQWAMHLGLRQEGF